MSRLKIPRLRARFGNLRLSAAATYIGFLIFVLALPFGYSVVFLNIGLSLVLLGWIGRIVRERRLGWRRTRLDLPLLLFLGFGLITSLFAPNPDTSSLGYLWKHLRAILLFYAVLHSGLGSRWRHLAVALIIAAGLASGLGLWYYANDTRLGIDFMGRVGLQFQTELQAGEEFSDALRSELRDCSVPLSETATLVASKQPDEWRIDDPARERRYVIRKGEANLMVYMIEQRLTGTFKMPNDLGAYLALTFPFCIGYFIAGCGTVRRAEAPTRLKWAVLALGAALLLMGAALALTLTRAAWVSVSLAVLFMGGYTLLRLWRRDIPWKRTALAALLLCGFIAIPSTRQAIIDRVPSHITNRFETLLTQPAGFLSERPLWWSTALQMIRSAPLTGIGPGRFRYEYRQIGPEDPYYTPYHAHNIYLHIAAEQGIPALLLFLWILTILWQQVFSLRNADDPWIRGTFIGAIGFLISALVYGLADNILHQRTLLLFWFILATIFYAHAFHTHPTKDTPYETTPNPD